MKYNLVDSLTSFLQERYDYELRGELSTCLNDLNNIAFPVIRGLRISKEEFEKYYYIPKEDNDVEADIKMTDANGKDYTLSLYDYDNSCYGIHLYPIYIDSSCSDINSVIDKDFSIYYSKDLSMINIRLTQMTFMHDKDFLRINYQNNMYHLEIFTDVLDTDTSITELVPDFVCDFYFKPTSVAIENGYEILGSNLNILNYQNEALAHKLMRTAIIIDKLYRYNYLLERKRGSK